jgi:hypothetical protein
MTTRNEQTMAKSYLKVVPSDHVVDRYWRGAMTNWAMRATRLGNRRRATYLHCAPANGPQAAA